MFLLPSELARKRLWNLKYPICIELAEGEGVMEEERGTVETPREEQGGDPQLQTRPTSNPKPAANLPTTIYLFGRTGREKEEWFHHFLSASTVMEKEKENERPGRCVSRSGRMNCFCLFLLFCMVVFFPHLIDFALVFYLCFLHNDKASQYIYWP